MRLLFLLIVAPVLLVASAPLAVYLLAGEDPLREVKVRWVAHGADPATLNIQGSEYEALMESLGVDDLFLFSVDVKELELGGSYRLRIGGEPPSYNFRLAPPGGEMRIAVAGDLFNSMPHFQRIAQVMREASPHLMVLGGDLAYTFRRRNSNRERGWELDRWIAFFQVLNSGGKKRELIPLAVVPGNHDLGPPENSLIAQLFDMEKTSYQVVQLPSLALFLLDSGHLQPIEGEQTHWLEKELQKQSRTPFKFAVYHIAAYPSVYEFDGEVPKRLRSEWGPLLEKGHVQAVFEHHNHAYKRTIPINGVVYLGDGASGVRAREPKPRDYLAVTSQENFFWFIRLQKASCTIESRNSNGKMMERLHAAPFAPLKLEQSNLQNKD